MKSQRAEIRWNFSDSRIREARRYLAQRVSHQFSTNYNRVDILFYYEIKKRFSHDNAYAAPTQRRDNAASFLLKELFSFREAR